MNMLGNYCVDCGKGQGIAPTRCEDCYLKNLKQIAFDKGYEEALRNYVYWKDGVQYVGSYETTLQQAIEDYKAKSK